MAEARRTEHRVEAPQQAGVAAVVDRHRLGGLGLLARREVRVDVRAPEGVDGLLGIAHQHEARVASGERLAEDVPLDGVGVLELVDHDELVLRLQTVPDHVALWSGQGGLQPGQQVVVAEDPELTLAAVEALAHRLGEPGSHRRLGVGVVASGEDAGVGIGDDRVGDLHRGLAGEVERDPFVEALDQEIVDHLLGEQSGVFDEVDVALDVTGEADLAEDLFAEAVDGGDGGGVELGDRAGETSVSGRDLLSIALDEPAGRLVDRLLTVGEVSTEGALDRDEATPDAVSQLTGGGAGEGDEEHLFEGEAVGHRLDRQRGDAEGLSRAGAGFEHGDAHGRRSWSRIGSQRRRASRPSRVSSSSAHPGPASASAGVKARSWSSRRTPSHTSRWLGSRSSWSKR